MAELKFSTCVECGKQKARFAHSKNRPSLWCQSCGSKRGWQKSEHRITRPCQRCGKPFTTAACYSDQIKYCSKKCRGHKPPVLHQCERCGKEFTVLASSVGRKGRGKYCSEACYRPPIIRQCRNCLRKFRALPALVRRGPGSARFCSAECFQRFRGESSIEIITRDLLIQAGLFFTSQYRIGERSRFDFYIPSRNLLIDCDGSYWHSLPGMQERDQRKDAHARAAGYTIIRFSEDEIHSSSFPAMLGRALLIKIPHPQMELFADI